MHQSECGYEEEEEASKEGAFRTHFTTDIIRRRRRAIQTAINKHVEGDTISWHGGGSKNS